jgi:hypothetical protein
MTTTPKSSPTQNPKTATAEKAPKGKAVVRKALQEEAARDDLPFEEYITKLLASYDELEAKVRQLGALIEEVRITPVLSGRVEAGK